VLVAIDQHAADERVQLEVLQSRLAEQQAPGGAQHSAKRGDALIQALPLVPAQVRVRRLAF